MKICLLPLLILLSVTVLAQNFEIYTISDPAHRSKPLFGLRNKESGKITITPFYDEMYFFHDKISLRVKKDNRYGVLDSEGKLVVEVKYQNLLSMDARLFKVQLNDQWGLIDRKQELLIPIEYDEIRYIDRPKVIVRKNKKYGLLDESREILLPLIYDHLFYDKGLIIAEYKGKFGAYDLAAKEALPLVYDKLEHIDSTMFIAAKDGKYGTVDHKGKTLIPFKYDLIKKFRNGFARVQIGKDHGLIDREGRVLVPIIYDQPVGIMANMIMVSDGCSIGFYNKSGDLIIPVDVIKYYSYAKFMLLKFRDHDMLIDYYGNSILSMDYEVIQIINDEKAIVKQDGKYRGIYIEDESNVSDNSFDYIERLGYGWSKVKVDGWYGTIDDDFEYLAPPKYGWIYAPKHYFKAPAEYNFSIVYLKGKKGVINKKGKEIIPPIYKEVWFLDQRSVTYHCKKNGMWGIIDTLGNIIIPTKYKHVGDHGDGTFMVYRGGRWGRMNREGVLIMPMVYRNFIGFNKNIMAVSITKEPKFAFVDTNGTILSAFKYDWVSGIKNKENGYAMINGKCGFIDEYGNEVSPFEYDQIEVYAPGFLKLRKDSLHALFSDNGHPITQFKYLEIENFYKQTISRVNANGKWSHIDPKGRELYTPTYDEVTNFTYNWASARLGNKWTLISFKGVELTPFIYDEIYYSRKSVRLVNVRVGDKWGLLNLAGETVTPIKYSSISFFSENVARVSIKENDVEKFGWINVQGKEIVPVIYNSADLSEHRIIAIKDGKKFHYTLNGDCLDCEE